MDDENLRILYQEMILDHGRSPRHFHQIDDYTCSLEGFNPLCGDKITLYLKVDKDGIIDKASFQGHGCAISQASSSMMLEAITRMNKKEALELFKHFRAMCLSQEYDKNLLGKLHLLEGVKAFPSRIKCATLAWHTLEGCLHNGEKPITTEE